MRRKFHSLYSLAFYLLPVWCMAAKPGVFWRTYLHISGCLYLEERIPGRPWRRTPGIHCSVLLIFFTITFLLPADCERWLLVFKPHRVYSSAAWRRKRRRAATRMVCGGAAGRRSGRQGHAGGRRGENGISWRGVTSDRRAREARAKRRRIGAMHPKEDPHTVARSGRRRAPCLGVIDSRQWRWVKYQRRQRRKKGTGLTCCLA